MSHLKNIKYFIWIFVPKMIKKSFWIFEQKIIFKIRKHLIWIFAPKKPCSLRSHFLRRNETFMEDFQPLWIDVRFFKYFFPLWKIVKNDDFFVMGDDNLNAKNTFRKIMDFPGKQTFKWKCWQEGAQNV